MSKRSGSGYRPGSRLDAASDDDDEERPGERLDQVEAIMTGHGREELVDDFVNARRQPLHGARREGFADQRAQAGVGRRILEEQAELLEAGQDAHVRALVSIARVD
jgi:hypothetical protein